MLGSQKLVSLGYMIFCVIYIMLGASFLRIVYKISYNINILEMMKNVHF
jgi:hypothetical protein